MRSFSFLITLLAVALCLAAVAARASDDRLSHSKSVSRSQISRSIAIEAEQLLRSDTIIKADGTNFDTLVGDKDKFTVILFHAKWSGRSNRFATVFANVAEMYEGNKTVQFIVLDVNANEAISRRWKIDNFPEVRMVTRGVIDTANTFHYLYDGVDAFVDFVERVLLREKWRYARQAGDNPAAAQANTLVHPNQGAVIELNRESFDNFTKSTHFFTFVMFYAPWCGACKELEEDLAAVARYFKKDRQVIIGRVNADDEAALINRYGISALPTMYMFPRARLSKRGIRYTGQRDRRDMQAIIDTQNRMADSPDMPYIDENTDMETLMAEMKAQGRDPESLMRSYRSRKAEQDDAN